MLKSRPAGKTRKRASPVLSLAKLRKKISKELKMSRILPYTPAKTVPKNHFVGDDKTPFVERRQSVPLSPSKMEKKKDDLDKTCIKKVKRVLRKMKNDSKVKTK